LQRSTNKAPKLTEIIEDGIFSAKTADDSSTIIGRITDDVEQSKIQSTVKATLSIGGVVQSHKSRSECKDCIIYSTSISVEAALILTVDVPEGYFDYNNDSDYNAADIAHFEKFIDIDVALADEFIATTSTIKIRIVESDTEYKRRMALLRVNDSDVSQYVIPVEEEEAISTEELIEKNTPWPQLADQAQFGKVAIGFANPLIYRKSDLKMSLKLEEAFELGLLDRGSKRRLQLSEGEQTFS
jgi:hypothetical protein